MRPTRKRKAIALRFDSLEPRALQAGGITPNDTLYSQQWGLSNPTTGVDIQAPQAWAISTGSPTVIVADVGSTGVNLNNPDLAGKIWTNPTPNSDPNYPGALHGWNFTANSPDVTDSDGHGTNVAGIIGAASNNGQGIAGVAWASPIMPLKGTSVTQDAAAVRFAVDHGAKVINMSFGYTYNSPVTTAYLQQNDPLYQAVQYADAHGVVVVAAAGNSGTAGSTSGTGQDLATTPIYPAAFRLPNMIAVAAVDSSGNLAGFSNYGATTVDLACPRRHDHDHRAGLAGGLHQLRRRDLVRRPVRRRGRRPGRSPAPRVHGRAGRLADRLDHQAPLQPGRQDHHRRDG